jgi:hypothetical protein
MMTAAARSRLGTPQGRKGPLQSAAKARNLLTRGDSGIRIQPKDDEHRRFFTRN